MRKAIRLFDTSRMFVIVQRFQRVSAPSLTLRQRTTGVSHVQGVICRCSNRNISCALEFKTLSGGFEDKTEGISVTLKASRTGRPRRQHTDVQKSTRTGRASSGFHLNASRCPACSQSRIAGTCLRRWYDNRQRRSFRLPSATFHRRLCSPSKYKTPDFFPADSAPNKRYFAKRGTRHQSG